MKLILGRGNEAHTKTVAAVVVVVGAEVRVVEVHVPRAAATFVRSRPVVAAGTDVGDRSPVPVASSRQEDRTVLLQRAPLGSSDRIAGKTCVTLIGTTQTVVARAPVVGQQNDTVYVVHLCLGIADAACRGAGVEHVLPFLMGRRAPGVGAVAAVAYRVVMAPIAVGIAARQVVGRTIQAAAAVVRIPRTVIGVAAVPAARAPAEKVYPAAVGLRDVAVGIAHIVVLVLGKLPGVRRGLVLQVALREPHLVAVGVNGKETIDGTCRSLWRCRSREAHLAAIARALAVDGIGADVIGGVRCQAGHVRRERTRPRAAAGVAAAHGRVVACAPADAALGHRRAAVSGHVAPARGRRLRDVRHLGRRHRGRGHVLAGGEAHLAAIARALAVGSVGPHIIGCA